MGTENQQPSGGISGLQSQYGGTGLAAGPYGDPNDLDLIWDRKKQTPIGRAEIGQASGGWRGTPAVAPEIKRSSEAYKHIYAMPDEEVGELQRRLWAGGFYPPGADPEDVALGDRDPYTDNAWQSLVNRAAQFKNAGRDLTIWEVLDMGANIRKEGGAGGDGSGGGGRPPLVTELTNPEDLKYVAQRTAVSALGRALKPDELSRFISSFHGSQQTAQAQAYNAAGGAGGSVVSAPDPTAAAASFARQAAPTEAGAHDFVKVYDVFSKMLGGRRG